MSASRLHGPGPAAAKKSHRKQKSTADSPWFWIGHTPFGKCALK